MDAQVLETRRVSVAAQLQAAKAKLEELIAGPRREVIEAAQAEVHRWQAQAALAAVTQDRNRKLFLTKAVSRQELDDATFGQGVVDAQLLAAQARLLELQRGTRAEQIAAQRAAVAQKQAELSTIDVQLAKSKLRAPFAGVIAARQVDDGTVIEAGTPVVELVETSHLEVRVGVTDDVLRQLAPGVDQQVFIGEQPHTAVVRAIRPDRDQQTRTISVLLALPLRQPSVRVGDLATVRFTAREHQPGFWLPTSALTEGYRGLWGCYVAVPRSIVSDSAGRKSKPRVASANETSVRATHQLQRRELEVLHHQTEVAFVRGSLNDGELVVPVGLQRLVPGQLVRLASETSE